MKRLFVSSLFCLLAIFSSAQSIGAFLDFYLGQSISDVRRITSSKYLSVSWDNNQCTINNIQLAGERFSNLFITFQNGFVSEAQFVESSTSSGSYSYLTNFLNTQCEVHKQMIGRLYSAYTAKYGKESVMNNQSVIWRSSNGNCITISLEVHSDDLGFGDYIGSVATRVKYSSSSFGNY